MSVFDEADLAYMLYKMDLIDILSDCFEEQQQSLNDSSDSLPSESSNLCNDNAI
jgi:hypothetical protein